MSLKIVAISDTHGKHRSLDMPKADVLLHCGDITNRGEISILEDFVDWLKDLPIKHKVIVFGNHSVGLQNEGKKRHTVLNIFKNNNINYLDNSSVVIEGIKFYGSAASPRFGSGWAYNYNRGKDIASIWSKIEDDTNVLLTHSPPYGILDLVEDNYFNRGRNLHQGCTDLLNRINSLKELKLSCFGHLHLEGCKMAQVNNVNYINAAQCDEEYQIRNKPMIIEL